MRQTGKETERKNANRLRRRTNSKKEEMTEKQRKWKLKKYNLNDRSS
jgi:hypothetical protein